MREVECGEFEYVWRYLNPGILDEERGGFVKCRILEGERLCFERTSKEWF